MRTYWLVIIFSFIFIWLSSPIQAVNSPQCLLQKQAEMDVCENVEMTALGFSVPTLSNVLTFVIRGVLVGAGLIVLFVLLRGAIEYMNHSTSPEESRVVVESMRNAVLGLILIIGVLSIVWTLEQVIFKRRLCLGLTCPVTIPSILKTTEGIDCCLCLIKRGQNAGKVGEVINRYEQSCSDYGIGVDVTEAVKEAQAQKIADDMRAIRGKLIAWKGALGGDYPHESIFATVIPERNPNAVCHDDPLFSEILKLSALNKNLNSYLPSVPDDPFGVGYVYDNDGEKVATNVNAGVNVFLQWCTDNAARYLDLAPRIDTIIDQGDGRKAGSFMWDPGKNGKGNYILRLEPVNY